MSIFLPLTFISFVDTLDVIVLMVSKASTVNSWNKWRLNNLPPMTQMEGYRREEGSLWVLL